MAILLEAADTGSNLDITTEQSIGSYTASGAKMVLAQIRLSNLNGAAATVTAKMQHTDAADTLIGTRDATATAKDAAANTVWSGRALGPIYLADGEKAICKVTSTNASDTAAAWVVEWLDAQPGVDLISVNGTAISLVTTMPANVTQIGGVAQSATDLKDFVDTGYDPATHKVAGVVLTDTCTTNTDMRGTDSALTTLGSAAPNDWVAAASVKADAVTKIQSGLATPTNITAGTITTVTNLTNAPTNGDLTAAMKASVTAAVPTAQNIWEYATRVLTAATNLPSASDIATAVWGAGTRTLSSFGTLVADVATAVWGAVARTITGGTVDTCTSNTDMRGTDGAYTGTPPTADAIGTDVAGKVLATPANKLATDASGYVTASNMVDTSYLAKEATLEAIKGEGWVDESLKAIYDNVPTVDTASIAAAILETPENLLATNADGSVNAMSEESITNAVENAIAASEIIDKIRAAVHGSYTITGNVITLDNGDTFTILKGGRITND